MIGFAEKDKDDVGDGDSFHLQLQFPDPSL
jgi:hypothetical protein